MKIFRASTIAAGLGMAVILGGCASTSDLDALRAEVQTVKTTADQAARDASDAQASSQRAQAAAEDAARAAREARDISASTEAKIDRMFKRSMYK